jgi:hypothetical protein
MNVPTCDRCGVATYGSWVYVGGRREGSMRHDATRLCYRCAGEEIDRLQNDVATLDNERTIREAYIAQLEQD